MQTDRDRDGVGDACDSCPEVSNPMQVSKSNTEDDKNKFYFCLITICLSSQLSKVDICDTKSALVGKLCV